MTKLKIQVANPKACRCRIKMLSVLMERAQIDGLGQMGEDSRDMNRDNCETKTRLVGIYQGVSQIYSKAVADLTRAIGKVDNVQHAKLTLAAERAWLAAQEARTDLDAHMIDHGC